MLKLGMLDDTDAISYDSSRMPITNLTQQNLTAS
jgi:hypothetical protein